VRYKGGKGKKSGEFDRWGGHIRLNRQATKKDSDNLKESEKRELKSSRHQHAIHT